MLNFEKRTCSMKLKSIGCSIDVLIRLRHKNPHVKIRQNMSFKSANKMISIFFVETFPVNTHYGDPSSLRPKCTKSTLTPHLRQHLLLMAPRVLTPTEKLGHGNWKTYCFFFIQVCQPLSGT